MTQDDPSQKINMVDYLEAAKNEVANKAIKKASLDLSTAIGEWARAVALYALVVAALGWGPGIAVVAGMILVPALVGRIMEWHLRKKAGL